MRLYELPKSVVAAIKHYSHRQNVDRGTTGEASDIGLGLGFQGFCVIIGPKAQTNLQRAFLITFSKERSARVYGCLLVATASEHGLKKALSASYECCLFAKTNCAAGSLEPLPKYSARAFN